MNKTIELLTVNKINNKYLKFFKLGDTLYFKIIDLLSFTSYKNYNEMLQSANIDQKDINILNYNNSNYLFINIDQANLILYNKNMLNKSGLILSDNLNSIIKDKINYLLIDETNTDSLDEAKEIITKLKLNNKELTQNITELELAKSKTKNKARYLDEILSSKKTCTVNSIAKDYGMSATKFNDMLKDLKIQYKNGNTGQWFLYQQFAKRGYVTTKVYRKKDMYGISKQTNVQTVWTYKGRKFLYEKLKSIGILPMIERED